MFHPLLPDLSSLTDQQIDDKIKDLTKTYFNALRMSPSAAEQVVMLLDGYRGEKTNREMKRMEQVKSTYNGDLDDLINIG